MIEWNSTAKRAMRKIDPVKHEEKRQQILSAAEKCFILKGFQGTSIAEICAAAGISHGHLYHYFVSKEEIVEAIARLRLEAGTEALKHIMTRPDSFAAFIKQICRPMPGPDSGHLLLELLAESTRNPAVNAMIREQSGSIVALFSDLIRAGQVDGKVDAALDPDIAASVLLSIVIDGTKALSIRRPNLGRNKVSVMIELLVTRFLAARSPH